MQLFGMFKFKLRMFLTSLFVKVARLSRDWILTQEVLPSLCSGRTVKLVSRSNKNGESQEEKRHHSELLFQQIHAEYPHQFTLQISSLHCYLASLLPVGFSV